MFAKPDPNINTNNQTNQTPNSSLFDILKPLLPTLLPSLLEQFTGQKLTQPNNNAEILTSLTQIQQQQLQFQQELMNLKRDCSEQAKQFNAFQQKARKYLQSKRLEITQ